MILIIIGAIVLLALAIGGAIVAMREHKDDK